MRVIALVGSSGTGKSHRALLVAHEYGADAIIDDGLLIKKGRIVAGISAKKQATAIGAIKTALFTSDSHAAEIMNLLKKDRPECLLVLGTSVAMVDRITSRLKLPSPELYLNIEEVASPGEISKAQKMRENYGKHVIPAPSVEVKRRLSGTLADPLQTFLKKKYPQPGKARHLWINQTVVRPTFNFYGKFFISDLAIKHIVEGSLHSFPSIVKVQHIQMDSNSSGACLSLDLIIKMEGPLPPLLRAAQKAIKDAVEHMTALHVIKVNIFLRRIIIDEKNPDKSLK
ncbi:MAG: Asp23/Gls24 family envelope stress response protein [Clostridia bacterium]|jgi:ABC-type dipeptide/oligopeptide/nickel transport system ATPase component|nr:Asp23/Gls24 family envelope stress response protein [Clostridia bacterium]